jgi:hypothetical protein
MSQSQLAILVTAKREQRTSLSAHQRVCVTTRNLGGEQVQQSSVKGVLTVRQQHHSRLKGDCICKAAAGKRQWLVDKPHFNTHSHFFYVSFRPPAPLTCFIAMLLKKAICCGTNTSLQSP